MVRFCSLESLSKNQSPLDRLATTARNKITIIVFKTTADMKLSLGSYSVIFSPGWAVSLFAGFFIPVFLLLGNWQMQRAEQKTEMVEAQASRASQPPTSLVRAVDLAEPAYQRVDFSAIATPDKLIYLDNRTRGSAPGVEVLLPVQSEGRWVLLNLGFLAKPRRIDLPAPPVLPQTIRVQGYLYATDKARVVLADSPTQGWPRLLQRLDFDAAEQALGVRIEPWQVRINPDHPLALTTEWKVSVTGPEKHLGYATQWFSMAFALFCMWIYAGLRRGSGDNNEKR